MKRVFASILKITAHGWNASNAPVRAGAPVNQVLRPRSESVECSREQKTPKSVPYLRVRQRSDLSQPGCCVERRIKPVFQAAAAKSRTGNSVRKPASPIRCADARTRPAHLPATGDARAHYQRRGRELR